MWIKITNCTTSTGGGKKPLRWRKNQNVKVFTDYPEMYNKPNIRFIENRNYYYTTVESKIIILKK